MLYIVPSRGRPANITNLLKAWEATRHCAQLWICIDDDDPEIEGYQALAPLPDWAKIFIGQRMRLGPTLNRYAALALAIQAEQDDDGNVPVIGFMGDDHLPRTAKWDLAIQRAANHCQGRAVIYGNDLVQGQNLPTAVAITTDIIKKLGYFCPPDMIHLYLDNAWSDIGRATGSFIYLPNVIIEHCHPHAGKGVAWDDRYAEVNGQEMYTLDAAAYAAWCLRDDWRSKLAELCGVNI